MGAVVTTSNGSAISRDVPVPIDPATDPDIARLESWLRERLAPFQGNFSLLRFTGGHANLTYLVRAGSEEFVLKREPTGHKAKSAHDMRREYHVLSHVASVYPFAPKPVLLCEDESVFGGVFCLMQRIQGEIVRSSPAPNAAGDVTLARRFLGLVDALAGLHRLDVAGAGLADFGKPDGYRIRQVQGWCRRFTDARVEGTDSAEDIIGWLQASIPSTPQAKGIIHNDFKMDNLVWDTQVPDRLRGVLDWEMATVGDPLMDLACTLSFWIEEADPAPLRSLRAMPSDRPGMPSREDAVRRYGQRTQSDVTDLAFYRCFGLFRRAAIEQQKYYRYVTRQTLDARYANLDRAVAILLEACREVVGSGHRG